MAGRNSRVGWTKLSAAQRKRYISAGRSGRLSGSTLNETEARSYYESGASLGGARGHLVYDVRGHKRVRPAWAAPKDPTERAQVSLLTTKDRKLLDAWQRSRAYPQWLPREFRPDVAAILSEVDVAPARWRHLTIEQQPGGRYTLTIEITGRPTLFVTTLPDWLATSEVGSLLNDNARSALARNGSERAKLDRQWRSRGGNDLHIGVDITETDRLVKRRTSPMRSATNPKPKKKTTKRK